jgi:hypothetical protein
MISGIARAHDAGVFVGSGFGPACNANPIVGYRLS